jgi:plastocyanin
MTLFDRFLPKQGRVLMLAGTLIIGTTVLASCSNESDAGADDATVLDVSLGRFVLEPSVLEAPAGDLVLRVKNDDPDLIHNLVVLGKGTRRLDPGESQTLEIPDVAVGEYRMLCDVPSHPEAGMTGTLVVTPAASPASADLSGTDTGY